MVTAVLVEEVVVVVVVFSGDSQTGDCCKASSTGVTNENLFKASSSDRQQWVYEALHSSFRCLTRSRPLALIHHIIVPP